MNVGEERKYVIVCNRHSKYVAEALLFWGRWTDDNAKRRSFGGYTQQIDRCERYTRKELEEWRGDNKKDYPFFDELSIKEGSTGLREFRRCQDVFISVEDLNSLGFSRVEVMVRL